MPEEESTSLVWVWLKRWQIMGVYRYHTVNAVNPKLLQYQTQLEGSAVALSCNIEWAKVWPWDHKWLLMMRLTALNNDTFYMVIIVTWHNSAISSMSVEGQNLQKPRMPMSGILIILCQISAWRGKTHRTPKQNKSVCTDKGTFNGHIWKTCS
jgi:hypothetical protein